MRHPLGLTGSRLRSCALAGLLRLLPALMVGTLLAPQPTAFAQSAPTVPPVKDTATNLGPLSGTDTPKVASSSAPTPGSRPAVRSAQDDYAAAKALVERALEATPAGGQSPSLNLELLSQAHALLRHVLAPERSLSPRSAAQARLALGTVLLLQNDAARAILELRRAGEVCPWYEQSLRDRIQTTLNTARERAGTVAPAPVAPASAPVRPQSESGGTSSSAPDSSGKPIASPVPASSSLPPLPPIDPLASRTDLVRASVPASWRLALAVACAWIAALWLLIAGLRPAGWMRAHDRAAPGGRRPAWPFAALIIGVGLALWMTVRWETRHPRPVQGVLLTEAQPHRGPDSVLFEATGSPLRPGTEVVILARSDAKGREVERGSAEAPSVRNLDEVPAGQPVGSAVWLKVLPLQVSVAPSGTPAAIQDENGGFWIPQGTLKTVSPHEN